MQECKLLPFVTPPLSTHKHTQSMGVLCALSAPLAWQCLQEDVLTWDTSLHENMITMNGATQWYHHQLNHPHSAPTTAFPVPGTPAYVQHYSLYMTYVPPARRLFHHHPSTLVT